MALSCSSRMDLMWALCSSSRWASAGVTRSACHRSACPPQASLVHRAQLPSLRAHCRVHWAHRRPKQDAQCLHCVDRPWARHAAAARAPARHVLRQYSVACKRLLPRKGRERWPLGRCVKRHCRCLRCPASARQSQQRPGHTLKAGARRRMHPPDQPVCPCGVVFVFCVFDDRVGRVAGGHTHLAAQTRSDRWDGTAGTDVRDSFGGRTVSIVLVEPVELFVLAGLSVIVETLWHLTPALTSSLVSSHSFHEHGASQRHPCQLCAVQGQAWLADPVSPCHVQDGCPKVRGQHRRRVDRVSWRARGFSRGSTQTGGKGICISAGIIVVDIGHEAV